MNNMQEYLPALLTGDIDYANCIPLEWYRSNPLTCVLGVSVNHQMVSLQSWRFGECGVPLHFLYSQLHFDPK